MTAYLQPGDKIHLAFPAPKIDVIGAGHPTQEQIAQAEKMQATKTQEMGDILTARYAEQGIEVVIWSANPSLTDVAVVAVFRPSPVDMVHVGVANMEENGV